MTQCGDHPMLYPLESHQAGGAGLAKKPSDPVLDAVQDLLIVQLALAGVDTRTIRRVARVDMNRVTRVSKALKKRRKRKGDADA